jgi:hypothetical protein
VRVVPEPWKWLFAPLGSAMRRRLEVVFGVVVTGAAMVGLSTVIRPDPSRLAAMTSFPMYGSSAERASERAPDADFKALPPTPPKVAPDFVKAVAAGDLVTMARLYTRGMALDGMLAVAAEAGGAATTLWLLDHGADVHEDEDTIDAAVLVGDAHPDVIAVLLAHGATEPSLAIAAEASAEHAVDRLLDAHARADRGEPSPLYGAVSATRGTPQSRRGIVEKLLAAGADPNREGGVAPLTAAVRRCDSESGGDQAAVVECLTLIAILEKHHARASGEAIAAALAVDEASRDQVFEAVLAAPLERGATAMALTQMSVPPRALRRLVGKGVDWSWHDGENDAALPLLSAVQQGDRDFVRALLDAGAPANVHFKDGTSPLGAAIDGAANGGADYARIVELLVARGVDVNRRLPDGRTPLFAAAESGEIRVVNALLERGARVNDIVLDDTALDAAEQNGHLPAARVLHAHGGRRARGSPSAMRGEP